MTFDLTLSNRKINANIKSIRRKGEELNTLVHDTFVLVAIHSQATGDCSGADRLLNALGAGLVKSAPFMIETLMKHTPIQVQKKAGAYHANVAKEGSKNYKEYDIDGLRANPWWTMDGANDRPPVIWDVEDVARRLMNVAKQIRNKIEADEVVGAHKAEMEMLALSIDTFAKQQVPSVMGEVAKRPANGTLPVVEMTETPAIETELKAVAA